MRLVGMLVGIIVAVVLLGLFVWVYVIGRGPTDADSGHAELQKRTLAWDPSANAESYTVKCGTEHGRYTLPPITVRAPETSVDLNRITQGPGRYFCVVTASNKQGESGPSSEIVIVR